MDSFYLTLTVLLVVCVIAFFYYLIKLVLGERNKLLKNQSTEYEDRQWYILLIEDEQKILLYLTLESDKAQEAFNEASKQFAAKEVVIVKNHAYAPHRIWKMWIAKNFESRLRSITMELFFMTPSDEAAWKTPIEKPQR